MVDVETNNRYRYINNTNKLKYIEFNKYFDGLTLLKSTELSIQNNDTNNEYILKLKQCFFKNTDDVNNYYNGNLPNIEYINANQDNLFDPLEVIKNLYNNIIRYNQTSVIKLRNKNDFDAVISLKYGLIDFQHPYTPIEPIFSVYEIPIFPIEKTYYLDYHDESNNIPINIEVIKNINSRNIFSFSLFIANKYLDVIHKYIYDPTYELSTDLKLGKRADNYFYINYLNTQLTQCIYLIKNMNIIPDTPGNGHNQWHDFGCLILVDKFVLELPMMKLVDNGQGGQRMEPWIKDGQNINQDYNSFRSEISGIYQSSGGRINEVLRVKNNWGTVQDYIIRVLNRSFENDENNNNRIGIYKYDLGNDRIVYHQFQHQNQTFNIQNSVNFLGSIVRFLPLQDPQFNTILFRDAHSTMPNRNYLYDRKWYETWQQQPTLRFWMYHAPHYNPPHAEGLKTSLAATWGAKKINNYTPILSPNEYSNWFGFNVTGNNFFNKPGYGIDERIMYKLVRDDEFLRSTYFVGMTFLYYLITGQDNPRQYQIFRQDQESGILIEPPNDVAVDLLEGIRYPQPILQTTSDQNYICRPLSFSMPSYSFFTDIRCVLLYSITQAAIDLSKQKEELTMYEYFSWLEEKIRNNRGTAFEINLLQMIPPRWNLFHYLFSTNMNENEKRIINFLKDGISSLGVNRDIIENTCDVNKYMWTGNVFNFDEIIYGKKYPGTNQYQHIPLPQQIIVPNDYPINTNTNMVQENL